MKDTFEVKSYGAQSLACALLLAFASFSILPLSVALVEVSKPSEDRLVRVYSRASGGHSEVKPSGASSAPKPVRVPPFSDNPPSEIREPALDFSSVGVKLPDLSSRGELGFDLFGGVVPGLPDGGKFEAFELSSLDKIPRRLNSAHVKYPSDLLRRGVEGEVLLNVVIDEDGSLEVVSVADFTNAAFVDSAVSAASKLNYEPPTKNGERVRAKFVLPIPFKIRQ